jgi:hypothetical protein
MMDDKSTFGTDFAIHPSDSNRVVFSDRLTRDLLQADLLVHSPILIGDGNGPLE